MQSDVRYLVFDVESVPDPKLIRSVRYPKNDIDDAEVVKLYQEELIASGNPTGFIPVTFQYPVAIVIAKVSGDFSLSDIVCLDEPQFRTGEMVKLFWQGIERTYSAASMVTFNGRSFDLPLLELMAFRYGYQAASHFKQHSGRYRFGNKHIDLHDWMTNFGSVRLHGGLDMLAKAIGKPGKMETKGDQVYDLFVGGELRRINDYCIHDVLDTYFVFLRTRVMTGEITLEREQDIVRATKKYITENQERVPAFQEYLRSWGDWSPWP